MAEQLIEKQKIDEVPEINKLKNEDYILNISNGTLSKTGIETFINFLDTNLPKNNTYINWIIEKEIDTLSIGGWYIVARMANFLPYDYGFLGVITFNKDHFLQVLFPTIKTVGAVPIYRTMWGGEMSKWIDFNGKIKS